MRGDRFHPSKIVAMFPGLGVPGRGTCLYTEQLDDSVAMGAPFDEMALLERGEPPELTGRRQIFLPLS